MANAALYNCTRFVYISYTCAVHELVTPLSVGAAIALLCCYGLLGALPIATYGNAPFRVGAVDAVHRRGNAAGRLSAG